MKDENIKNPQAFPVALPPDPVQGWSTEHIEGMTLRDYAQIKFMSAVISNAQTMSEITTLYKKSGQDGTNTFEDKIAALGGFYADSMLRERSKQ